MTGNGSVATNDPPNLGLLIKLMKLTTSTNDAEALAALRKANEQLAKFGGDWERTLRGKITVIGDPFEGASAPTPPAHYANGNATPTPTQAYRAPSMPQQPYRAPSPTRRRANQRTSLADLGLDI